jgi:hypothetical protein
MPPRRKRPSWKRWTKKKAIDIRAAIQAPEFSEKTMAADWWTAVYLPIPENASHELLETALDVTSVLCRALEQPSSEHALNRPYEPIAMGTEYTRAENLEHAAARLAELEIRLDRSQEVIETLAAESDTLRLAQDIDDDRRRHRDDSARDTDRAERVSADRTGETREETAQPLYDEETGERLDEADQDHEAGPTLSIGGGLGR